jgi:hypothetical protein
MGGRTTVDFIAKIDSTRIGIIAPSLAAAVQPAFFAFSQPGWTHAAVWIA